MVDSYVSYFYMSGKDKKSPQNPQPKRKKRRVKSKQDTKDSSRVVSTDTGGVSTNVNGSSNVCVQSADSRFPQPQLNMASFQNPQNPQPMQMQGNMQPPMTFPYSPPPQGMGAPMNFGSQMQSNYKPEWANELINSVNQMGKELGKLNSIEKTLSSIKLTVTNLETKVGAMESKLNNCEKSCDFLSKEYEEQKKELKSAKSNISGLQKRCNDLESKCEEYEKKGSKLNKKLLDLESRSMRENLVFHGLPESPNENCETMVKQFCHNKLALDEAEANAMILDRVHRIGRPEKQRPGGARPIVAKFHRFSDREKIRELGFEKKDALRAENLAVKPQLPAEVLENRKPLYSVFEKAKADGNRVKFVLDKLYINGREYIPPE